MIPESVRALVSTGPFVHLTTLNPDGSPQVTVVWIGVDGDASSAKPSSTTEVKAAPAAQPAAVAGRK